MRSYPTQNRNFRNLVDVARAAHVCAMPAGSWPTSTILVITGHKPEPRRHPVLSV